MAKRRKKSRKLWMIVVFFICLYTGYQYDGALSWRNILNLDNISSVLSTLKYQVFYTDPDVEDATFIVHVIDVGQGDSILLQSLRPGEPSQNILIDAGESQAGKTVVSYLRKQGVKKLDAVVATHPHSDHIGGLPSVFKEFEVQSVYMPKKVYATQAFENLVEAVQNEGLKAQASYSGMSIPMEGVTIQILAPISGKEYDALNNYSVVLSVRTQGKHFIFAGDAEKLSESEQIEQGFYLNADVLKVGHHGSATSSSQEYIRAISPKYAIISCGKDNDYGLPSTKTLETLEEAGCTVLRTDESGTIVMKVKNRELTVYKEK